MTRDELESLEAERFDVAVIGGGITGAGVARHAALAGFSTLLLEQYDTSALPVRFGAELKDFQPKLYVKPRKSLKVMAPHLTQPQWMVVPARNRLEFEKYRLGITLYEWLGAVERTDRHRNWAGAELSQCEPLLDQRRYPYAIANTSPTMPVW